MKALLSKTPSPGQYNHSMQPIMLNAAKVRPEASILADTQVFADILRKRCNGGKNENQIMVKKKKTQM